MSKNGILLQGPISSWTKPIVKELVKNFPDTEILLSTWSHEDISSFDIPCKIIQTDPPKPTSPYQSTVNHQIVGAIAGLKNIECDILIKCRTDQYIHNKNIFEIFNSSCPKNKIMIPDYPTLEYISYFASDLCQIGTKNILCDYWNSVPYYDGSFYLHSPEVYLTANYIIRKRNDTQPWNICLRKYYYIKSFFKDFQIEWEKLNDKNKPEYKHWLIHQTAFCTKSDP